MIDEIPPDHPRAEALRIRHRLTDAVDRLVVAKAGLLAHGRGEAFDYLLGEKTPAPAEDAMRVAVAMLLAAKYPVISVNGNAVALNAKALVDFARTVGAKLEVNIFYAAPGRIEAIQEELATAGADEIFGLGDVPPAEIPELTSNRRVVDPRGILIADVVLVPLEDGDRTEALCKMGKLVIAIDLNPLSRTAQKATVTIVDNFLRCMPHMIELAREMRGWPENDLQTLIATFSNADNLRASIQVMIDHLTALTQLGDFLDI